MNLEQTPAATSKLYFADLTDPRLERTKRHQLLAIVVLAICAVICGSDDDVSMEEFGKAKEPWLRQFLELPNRIPTPDTFWRVFCALDPAAFQQAFWNGWRR
jgi:hypothetical protein